MAGLAPWWDTVRMEARRVGTVRVSYLLALSAVLLGGVIALMIALLAPPDVALSPARSAAALTAGGDAVPLSAVGGLMAILGVVTVGHDYRFGLLPVVFTIQPRRGVAVAARLSVLAAWAACVAVSVSLVGGAVCWMLGRPPGLDLATTRVAAAHVVLAVLWAWLGAGLAYVLRNSAGAVSLLLLGPLLIEPLLAVAGEESGSPELGEAVRWLPFTAARQALGRSLHGSANGIGALAAGLDFAAVSLVVLAAAWLLVRRRDA